VAIKTQPKTTNDVLKTMWYHARRIFARFTRDVIFAVIGVSVFTTLNNQTAAATTWLTVNIWLFMYHVFLFSLMAYGLSILIDKVVLPGSKEDG